MAQWKEESETEYRPRHRGEEQPATIDDYYNPDGTLRKDIPGMIRRTPRESLELIKEHCRLAVEEHEALVPDVPDREKWIELVGGSEGRVYVLAELLGELIDRMECLEENLAVLHQNWRNHSHEED